MFLGGEARNGPAFLWDKITDGVGEDLLAEKLTEEYDAEKDEAEEDVRAFLDRLQSFGIIDRGDNRNDSKDSRFEEVGNIHRDELEGKAVFRIWPLSKFGKVK